MRYICLWAPGVILAVCIAALLGIVSARGNVDAGWSAMLKLDADSSAPIACRENQCWSVVGGISSKKDCDFVLKDMGQRAKNVGFKIAGERCVDTLQRPAVE